MLPAGERSGMRRSFVVLLAAWFLCGNVCGCGGGAQVVRLEIPKELPMSDAAQPSSLLETVQTMAEAMLPDFQDSQEAACADASPVPPDVDPAAPMVALTFDDGPLVGPTDRILDILEANGARATFFIQGKQAARYPDLVRRAYGLGCQIGNHTYNHKDLTSLSDQDALDQIESVNGLVAELTGEGCALVRPPHGKGWRDRRVLNLAPYPLILWSIDTKDWETRSTSKTIAAVLDKARDGDIILMHDVYPETADAAASIIPGLMERGYRLVTVSEMFSYKGLELAPGHAYRHAE